MMGVRTLAGVLVCLAIAQGAWAISPPSEVVTNPASTQLTTLVPDAQNMQRADVLAVLTEQTARIAREITAGESSGPVVPDGASKGAAVLPGRREEVRKITVRQVAAGEAGLSAASALAMNQIRDRLAEVHQGLSGDAAFTGRADAGAVLDALKQGAQGSVVRALQSSRALVQLVRTPGALSDEMRAKVDSTLTAIYPLVRSLETQVAEGTD